MREIYRHEVIRRAINMVLISLFAYPLTGRITADARPSERSASVAGRHSGASPEKKTVLVKGYDARS